MTLITCKQFFIRIFQIFILIPYESITYQCCKCCTCDKTWCYTYEPICCCDDDCMATIYKAAKYLWWCGCCLDKKNISTV